MAQSTIGRYILLEELGRGGMGMVYRAYDPQLDREVAIKVLPREALHDPTFRLRFEHEARTIATLEHPAIVPVYDVGEEAGQPYLVMRCMSGGTLTQRLRQGALSPVQASQLIDAIAPALDRAHRQGIIHRDLKPDNIMFDEEGFPCITDFGLAKIMHGTGQSSGDDLVLGTPAYMSPEQVRGEELDGRSDLYALGLMLFEMLTARHPFETEAPVGYLSAHLHKLVPDVGELQPGLPVSLNAIIQMATSKEREARYATAADLAANLRAALETGSEPASAPQPITARLTNLPVPPTLLIGRQRELRAIRDLLQRREVRLVTLAGPGGTGKTRLALQVAAEMVGEFAHGVWFVDLSPIRDPALIVPTISTTLGIPEVSGLPTLGSLKYYLRNKRLLLVLDNFEQLIDAAPTVAELVNEAPGLKVLISSREILRTSRERVFQVPPLDVPPPGQSMLGAEWSQFAAVQLFEERVQALDPSFSLIDQNAPFIVQICQYLDGLPLAIELAAARCSVFSPEVLLTRLKSGLGALGTGMRDQPNRQRTMRDAIAWSYDLLNQDEKSLFSRLGVFSRGFTLEAAEAVCGASGQTGYPAPAGDVITLVDSLLHKSLIRKTLTRDGTERFAMLETIHEFAVTQLCESGEEAAARNLHLEYYRQMLTQSRDFSVEVYTQSATEHDNIRACVNWALASGAVETVLAICNRLALVWDRTMFVSEVTAWLQTALESKYEVEEGLRATSLARLGKLLHQMPGGLEQGRTYAERSLALSRRSGAKKATAQALVGLGDLNRLLGNFPESFRAFEEALALFESLNDEYNTLETLVRIGGTHLAAGDLQQCESVCQQVFDRASRKEWALFRAVSCLDLGEAMIWAKDYERARSLLIDGTTTFTQTAGQSAITAVGEYRLGLLALVEENYPDARRHFTDSIEMFKRASGISTLLKVMESMASLSLRLGNLQHAARLLAACEALRSQYRMPLPPVHRSLVGSDLQTLRDQLDEAERARLWKEGGAMILEQAVDFALQDTSAIVHD